MVITLKMLVRAGICRPGIRSFCVRHGVDYNRLRAGIPVAEVRDIPDAQWQDLLRKLYADN